MAWRQSQVTLIREIPAARGVGTDAEQRRHTVRCTVRSIGQQEHYLAKGTGPMPELKLVLDYAQNYRNEQKCRFEGRMYHMERTYNPETNEIELILYPEDRIAADSEVTGNA